MPTRHGLTVGEEEQEGRELEGFKDGGRGLGVLGWRRKGEGCLYQSITGWQLTLVLAMAMGNWPEPSRSWPAVCVPHKHVCLSSLNAHVNKSTCMVRKQIQTPQLLSNDSCIAPASPPGPWHLTSQSISFRELAWECCIHTEHTLPVIFAQEFLFKLTFKPIHFPLL